MKKNDDYFKNIIPYLLTFVSTLLLLIIRCWAKLENPDLWAEDGALFLEEYSSYGINSIFNSYAGSLFLYPRIAILILYQISLVNLPLLIFISNIILFCLVISVFINKDYCIYIKNSFHRFLLILCFCLAPGLEEILGNLANSHSILYFLIAIKAIKPTKLSYLDLILILGSLFSALESVILFPLFVFRYFKKKDSYDYKNIIIMFVMITIVIIKLFHSVDKDNLHEKVIIPNFPTLATTYLTSLSRSLLFQPILGAQLYKILNINLSIQHFATLVYLYLLSKLICSKKKFHLIGLFLIADTFIPVLTWIVREDSINLFRSKSPSISWYEMRYSFLLSLSGILFISFFLKNYIKSKKLSTLIFYIFITNYAIGSLYRFKIKPYPVNNHWSEKIIEYKERIKKGECIKKHTIPISPQGWTVNLKQKCLE